MSGDHRQRDRLGGAVGGNARACMCADSSRPTGPGAPRLVRRRAAPTEPLNPCRSFPARNLAPRSGPLSAGAATYLVGRQPGSDGMGQTRCMTSRTSSSRRERRPRRPGRRRVTARGASSGGADRRRSYAAAGGARCGAERGEERRGRVGFGRGGSGDPSAAARWRGREDDPRPSGSVAVVLRQSAHRDEGSRGRAKHVPARRGGGGAGLVSGGAGYCAISSG